MNGTENSSLIQDLKRGHPGAFQELVDLHQGRVLNTCYRFVNNREDAEDIAQEVFIEVYRSISKFRREAKLYTWIYRIAISKSLDFIRKKKRKKRFALFREFPGEGGKVEELLAKRSSYPDAELERRERHRILWQALDSLADNQRIAITMSKYEGFTNKEVAEIMGTTVSSVEALIHRAKKNLRKKLYGYYKKKSQKSARYAGIRRQNK